MSNKAVSASLPPRSLIIAERARNIRRLLARELSREGYTIISLANAIELCQELEHGPARRIVLLDPDLPYLSECNVLECLRKAAARIFLLVHSYGAQPYSPLADITLATVRRTGDIGALRQALDAAFNEYVAAD